jgi:hypothetical protein
MATTADQIVVELRAVVDQHDAALNKSADTAEAAMKDIERAVDKATGTVVNDAARTVDAVNRESAAFVAAKEKEIAVLKEISAKADRSADDAKVAAGRILAINDEITRSYIRLAEAHERASKAALVPPPRVPATPSGLPDTPAGTGRRFGGPGGLQNVSYQLQDFIVQVSGGTDALRAFSQQGPQILSGFGMWGSVLGIAAAGVGILASSLGGFETAADRAKIAQKSFDDALKGAEGAMTEGEKKAAEFARKLSLVEAGYLSLAKTGVEAAIRDQSKELEKNAENTTRALGQVQSAINAYHLSLVNATTGDILKDKPFTDFYAKVKPILDRLAQPGLSTAEYSDLNQQLIGLQTTAKAFGVDLQGLIDGNAKSGQAALEHAAKLKELADINTRLNDLMGIGASVLRAFGISFESAAGQVVVLTNAVGGYIGQLRQALSLSGAAASSVNSVVANLRQQSQQMGDTVKSQKDFADSQRAVAVGQAAWTEEIKKSGNPIKALTAYQEALNLQTGITRREQRAASQGKTTAQEDLDNLKAQAAALNGTKEAQKRVAAEQRATAAANAAYSKELAESGNATEAARIKSETYATQLAIETRNQQAAGGAAKVSAAAKREARSDGAIEKIEQEIALQERLIAVHRQGPETLARERAAFDALSSARQLGYKTDTEANKRAHDQYVQRYEDLAEQKRLQDVVLADFSKAEALTKSVMTSQEAYNAKIAEYNRLRENGTLQEEAYTRLIRAAKAENDGYAEGIQAIGDAIEGGIQGATSFSDALLKIGLSLAKLVLQAALFGGTAGGGPLGGIFSSLTGLAGGLLGGLGGSSGGPNVSGLVPSQSTLPKLAGGGQAVPGNIYEVGETGREWFAPSVPGQVIPNSVIKNAAGGGGGGGPPIQFNINMAGANGDATIRAIAAQAVKQGLSSVPEINRQHRIRFSPT